MNSTDDTLARLREICPVTLEDTHLFLDDVGQRHVLEWVVRQPGLTAPLPSQSSRRLKPRPAAIAAAAALGAAALGLVAVVAGGNPSMPTTRLRAAHLRLAGHRFTLPRGYSLTAADTCAPAAIGDGQPLTVIQGMAVAASGVGGCLRAETVDGTVQIPAGAQPVTVGSAQGYESVSSNSTTLYVAVPSAAPDYLVLVGTGTSPSQLVAIAATAFPG